jgi:hypothetical protein
VDHLPELQEALRRADEADARGEETTAAGWRQVAILLRTAAELADALSEGQRAPSRRDGPARPLAWLPSDSTH